MDKSSKSEQGMPHPRRIRREQRFVKGLLAVILNVGLGLVILFLGWTAAMVVLQGLEEWKGL
jgi:hypothetical protein